MADVQALKGKVMNTVDNVRVYWKEPPKGRYMNYKEIISYAFGGIGAYFVIQLGSTLIVSTANTIVNNAIGIDPTHVYIIYLLATILNIPLTGIRANMVDNTRGKGGKYRPYLLTMGIPTALIAVAYVWFPYDLFYTLFPGQLFNLDKGYVIKCAVVFVFNLLLHFFFFFFQDAYTNLIHVLSPNTQERTDVLAIKSVVYSLAPSIMNILNPLVADWVADGKVLDLRVYRITYPVFAVIGIALTIVVFVNTQEKIVQAKTHTIQVSFIDAFKEVAKNKYFWIIALAGWLGFLEAAYGNILQWSQNYGHTATGGQLALINTLTGNASLWGMLLAPFCVKAFGKKKVLIGVNLMNVVCILLMIVNMYNIWWLFICVYFNWLFGAFEQITTPAIQADIRDYQQYRSGERIDGMFATVATIGNLVTLATSAVLPAVQKHYGVYAGNGYKDMWDVLDINNYQGVPLSDQPLYKLMGALIIMAAAGAFLNVVPYFFYDFTEKKQKGVIRVLQIRSLFEDYGNNALNNHQIVEAIDLVRNSREMAAAQPKEASKDSYKNIKDKAERKLAKKEYKATLNYNEEIDIAKFVCDELDKFNSDLFKHQVNEYSAIYALGLDGIKSIDLEQTKAAINHARKLPKNNKEEKEFRAFEIELAKKKRSAKKAYDKYYGNVNQFVEPDMTKLTALFDKEDELEEIFFDLTEQKTSAKKSCKILKAELSEKIETALAEKKSAGEELESIIALLNRKLYDNYTREMFESRVDLPKKISQLDLEIISLSAQKVQADKDMKATVSELTKKIDEINACKKLVQKESKALMDEFAKFNRAAKPYNDARKLLAQQENYSHFEEIEALYDQAKLDAEEEDRIKEEQFAAKKAEEEAELERRKALKAAKKNAKKNK